MANKEEILALAGELKDGSNWLGGEYNVYSYNRAPKQAAALLEVLAEISIDDLITALRAPESWRIEGYGHFKDATSKPSDAPFHAADVIEVFCHAARKPLEFERDVQKADIAFLNQQLADANAEIERLKLIKDSALKVCGQLDEVVLALPYDYLDQPDGGDVSLGEQVTRMYSEVKALRAKVEGEAELRQQLAEKDAEIERLKRSVSTAAKLLDVEGPTDVIDLIAAAQAQITQYRDALTKAKAFIRNGIALGFIRMPDADCPDPAHETPRAIAEALAQPTDTSALEAMIAKAGDVMRERERCAKAVWKSYPSQSAKDQAGDAAHSLAALSSIRTLPGVTLGDLG